jgi:2-methylisocitrate lyase-like PEP mutase family enzyme
MRASKEKLAEFHRLQESFFVLADIGSVLGAIACESAGYAAVGTTSVGLGLELGCPASQAISKAQMMQAANEICRAVRVPVCIDLESGYADTPEGVEAMVAEVIETGAVSFNLEDSGGIPGAPLRPAGEHAERIRAARRAADKAGLPIHIVGRTDPFWQHGDASEAERIEDAVTRANIYLAAGADAIFISGRTWLSLELLKIFVERVNGPLNTLIDVTGPSVEEYRRIGIRRLQTGSLMTRAQSGYVRAAMGALLQSGDLGPLRQYAITTKELSELMMPFWSSR